MSSTATYFTAILAALAILNPIAAMPQAKRTTFPELIPGPGLPSLASLGLTSADLYNMPTPKLSIRQAPVSIPECGPDEQAYTDVNDIIACYNYLNGLGTTQCSTPPGGSQQWCVLGSAQVTGSNTGNNADDSSFCSDVAEAVLWVINSCTRADGSSAGVQTANGNGDLVVGAFSVTGP